MLVAIPLVLVAADVIVWRYSVSRLQSGFDAWVTESRARGWTVQTGSTTAGGWPFAATLTMTDAVVSGGAPAIPGGMTWDASRVVLRVDLLHPWMVDIAPEGVQRLRFADGAEVPFVAEDMHASLPLNAEQTLPVDLQTHGVRVMLPDEAIAERGVTIGRLEAHAEIAVTPTPEGSPLDFVISAADISLPRGGRWPLGGSIASMTLDGAFDGPLPPPAPPAAALAAWRDGGGSLEIQKFSVVWGPLNLSATATLAVDDQLQPMGAGTSRIIGYEATLDALASNGVLTKSAATAAKAVLSLMASAPTADEASEVDVPLTLQYRTLSMRQVPLIRLPELDWPSR